MIASTLRVIVAMRPQFAVLMTGPYVWQLAVFNALRSYGVWPFKFSGPGPTGGQGLASFGLGDMSASWRTFSYEAWARVCSRWLMGVKRILNWE
jgi:hypothetical protein